MKKSLFFAVAATMLASCASDELVDIRVPNAGSTHSDIRFTTNQKNITRSWTELQKAGHYNFGVFAYKSTDLVNPVMPNYLVGYCDGANGYDQNVGSTWGDQEGLVDGQSWWAYEGLGNAEYNGTYAGAALEDAFKSNNANQYLKYWDNSAANTYFYAYAPYINGTGTATYVDGTAQAATGDDTYVLTIPNGTLKDGYDDESLSEYMYASVKVAKADYGHDVALQFQRLNAKVNIKFWEDVPGYKVRILDLSNTHEGVQAAASIKEAGKGDFGYKGGKYYTANGVKIKFADGVKTGIKQFEGTLAQPTVADGNNATTLKFKSPTEAQIGENRYAAVQSPTTYYAIPKGDGANVLADGNTNYSTDQACDADLAKTGFTFHVSYELTAEDTGEKIVVSNATVHVPFEYANWKANTHYTYIFKITKNSNGTTDDPGSAIDPTDPEVPTTPALYPIVFDNCTVVDWEENVSEWNISDATGPIYHDVQLSAYSIVTGDITVTVTDNDTYAGHAIDYSQITVTPADAKITYDNATHKITVAAGAAAGVYTVTYTCPATGDKTTHPSTWTEKFVVGNEYTITTHRDVIGTNSNEAEAKLNVTGTITTASGTNALSVVSANLSIDYPDNFKSTYYDATQLAVLKDAVQISGTDVVVKSNALPGVYKVVYSIADPVDATKKVKVAEHQFTVVDYSLTLSHTVVFNTDGGTTVTGNQTADANHVYTVEGPTSYTASVTSGTANIVVPNNSVEGTYTVTYTVYGNDDDKTVYTKTFEVRNTHSVAVTKTSISKSVGTSQASDYSTDVNTIKTTFNGVATSTDLSAKLSIVKSDKSATTTGDFKITYTSANEYKLEVKNGTSAGDYYVKFVQTVAGADKAEYVHFVVTE